MGNRVFASCPARFGCVLVLVLAGGIGVGSGTAYGRAAPAVIEANRRVMQEAAQKLRDDTRQSREELEADGIEIEIYRRKLRNELACLREKLEVDRDARRRAFIDAEWQRTGGDLQAVAAAIEAFDRSPDPQAAETLQAIEAARQSGTATISAAIERLKVDQARWSRVLRQDQAAYNAARQRYERSRR